MLEVLEDKQLDNASGDEVCHCFTKQETTKHFRDGKPAVALCGYIAPGSGTYVRNSTKPKCPECQVFAEMEVSMK